jgi:hypothetical protein
VQRDVDVAEKFEVLNFMSQREVFNNNPHSRNHQCIVLVLIQTGRSHQLDSEQIFVQCDTGPINQVLPDARCGAVCLASTAAITDTTGQVNVLITCSSYM